MDSASFLPFLSMFSYDLFAYESEHMNVIIVTIYYLGVSSNKKSFI